MRRNVPAVALLALAFSLNAVEPVKVPEPTAEEAKPDANDTQSLKAKFWHKVKAHKAQQFKDALSAAGVDAATSDKVMAVLKDMATEKNKEFKELKVKWHEELMKRLEEAGLTREKVQEVIMKHKEIKRDSMLKFIKERLQNHGEKSGPDAN